MTRALPSFERRLLPYAGAAAYLGISLRAMKELAAEGRVPKVAISNRVLFDRDDLDRLIDRLKAGEQVLAAGKRAVS